jgi:hypothetical protein
MYIMVYRKQARLKIYLLKLMQKSWNYRQNFWQGITKASKQVRESICKQ